MKRKLLALTLSALLCSSAFVTSASAVEIKPSCNTTASQVMTHNHYWVLVETYSGTEVETQNLSDGRIRTRDKITTVKEYQCKYCGEQKFDTTVTYTPWSYTY